MLKLAYPLKVFAKATYTCRSLHFGSGMSFLLSNVGLDFIDSIIDFSCSLWFCNLHLRMELCCLHLRHDLFNWKIRIVSVF